MTHSGKDRGAKSRTGALDAEDTVSELAHRQNQMDESMQKLLRFQRKTLLQRNTQNIDEAFDAMESLLLEVIDFAYVTLQHREPDGAFKAVREFRHESLAFDPALMDWVMQKQEVSVFPINIDIDGTRLRSLLFLPFGQDYIMLLWLEQNAEAFNREQEAFLSVLSREMATVLETHRYHARLEKTKAAMTDIVESVPLGLLALDHENRIIMLNTTAEIGLNVRRQEVVGRDYRETLPQNLATLLTKMIGEETAEEAEIVLRTVGGMETYIGVTVSSMRSADETSGAGRVVVCRDLQLSREVQKLRQLDHMKNDFLSLVSHELRTPLTSILAYSETLLMDENENMPKEWHEYIEIINSEGKRLNRLIEDVLDLTKMEAGKMTYEFEMHDPNEIIGSVIMAMLPLAEAKNHTLEFDLGEDIGDCRVDMDRFTQVVNNIVSNAIKYTEPGGKITIRSKRREPFPRANVPTFQMEVQDNGIGIAEENLDKVFSKFEMVEAIKHHSSGTGLGMAICKQIIEEGHSGRIWLQSKPGEGTTVFVRIPMQ